MMQFLNKSRKKSIMRISIKERMARLSMMIMCQNDDQKFANAA